MNECPCNICKQCRSECDHCGCYIILSESVEKLQAKYGMALAFITSLARNAHEAHPITVPMIAKELLRELGEVE